MRGEAESAARRGIPGANSIRAARGLELSCKGWVQEAALRMLMNALDPEVAEGRRVLECLDDLVRALRSLGNDETLLVQSGKPVGVFLTDEDAPRVLLCDSHRAGPMACGQTAAGWWMDIGLQGAVLEAYETFAAAGERSFGGEGIEPGEELAGRLIVCGGMGTAGGAQPMAATMAGAAFLGIEVDAERIKRRVKSGACDFMVNSLDEALRILKNAVRKKENISVGLVGNCAEVIPALAERGVVPDILTADPRHALVPDGYVPDGMTPAEALELRGRDPETYERRSLEAMARQMEGILRLQKMGAVTLDSGNHLEDLLPGETGVLRWVALSGAARDIAMIDELALQLFSENRRLRRWMELARRRIRFQGLPARVCRLGTGERTELGVAINGWVRQGKIQAPVAMGRDDIWLSDIWLNQDDIGLGRDDVGLGQVDCGPSGVDLAAGEMKVRGDAGDWPRLRALVKAASGASWAAIRGGEAGMGSWLHAAQAVVADGCAEAAGRIERVMSRGVD